MSVRNRNLRYVCVLGVAVVAGGASPAEAKQKTCPGAVASPYSRLSVVGISCQKGKKVFKAYLGGEDRPLGFSCRTNEAENESGDLVTVCEKAGKAVAWSRS